MTTENASAEEDFPQSAGKPGQPKSAILRPLSCFPGVRHARMRGKAIPVSRALTGALASSYATGEQILCWIASCERGARTRKQREITPQPVMRERQRERICKGAWSLAQVGTTCVYSLATCSSHGTEPYSHTGWLKCCQHRRALLHFCSGCGCNVEALLPLQCPNPTEDSLQARGLPCGTFPVNVSIAPYLFTFFISSGLVMFTRDASSSASPSDLSSSSDCSDVALPPRPLLPPLRQAVTALESSAEKVIAH